MSFPSAFPPALDSAFPPAVGEEGAGAISFDLAAGIYSVRRVRAAYTGPCMRVRRSSDNAEIDVFWAGGLVDSAAIMAHVGAGSGFVTTWYDQSGKANHAAQTTAGNQPTIVASGVMQMMQGRPSLSFTNAAEQRLNFSNLDVFRNVGFGCINATFRRTDTSAAQRGVCVITTPTGGFRLGVTTKQDLFPVGVGIGARRLDADAFLGAGTAYSVDSVGTTFTAGARWSQGFVSGWTRGERAVNITLSSSGTTSNTASSLATIGGLTPVSFTGMISEVILFNTEVDAARLNAVTSAFWST